jgi:ABC transport system ATP-binding/permease protein
VSEPRDEAALPSKVEVRSAGRRWVFDPGHDVLIGRDEGADVPVADTRVSRTHARLFFEDSRWVVRAVGDRQVLVTRGAAAPEISINGEVEIRLADGMTGPVLHLSLVEGHADEPDSPYPLVIGRDPDCGLSLDDPFVSRQHAVVTRRADGVLEIHDLGSRHHVFVNGVARLSALLTEGDKVGVGTTDLVVSEGHLVTAPGTHAGTLTVDEVGYRTEQGVALVEDVSFDLTAGQLVAVIGPSGAGKSTLLSLIRGVRRPTHGGVYLESHDLASSYEALKHRIGVVPQEDVVHRQLTVRAALSFAARLRLAEDLTESERSARVDQAMADLDLTPRADVRIDKLSGGQRKRVSIAMELLMSPTVLLLDEPTSGLDPHLDRQVMQLLRRLADSGRVVLVVTHTTTNLDICDQVLLLAPGGKPAYLGPPARMVAALEQTDYTGVFAAVAADPGKAHASYRSQSRRRVNVSARSSEAVAPPVMGRREQWAQTMTLARRQARIIAADPGYAAFVLLLPLALAFLVLAVPGSAGLSRPSSPVAGSTEASQLLVVLILASVFMGTAASVRDLVAERPIFRRERAAGVAPLAYLGSKLLVFGAVSSVQASLLTSVALVLKPGPSAGLALPAPFMLWAALTLTTLSSSYLGLLLSAVARSVEQVMPLLVVSVMLQLVLSGGLTPVTDRGLLTVVSVLAPARWGYAAAAAVADLKSLVPTAPDDPLWDHSPGQWLVNVLLLVVLAGGWAALTWIRLRREER